MALLYFDGFEYAPIVRSSVSPLGAAFFSAVGRDGVGKGLAVGSNGSIQIGFPFSAQANTRLIFGWGHEFKGAMISSAITFASFVSNGTNQCRLQMTSGGLVQLVVSGVAATSTAVLGLGWHYFEVDVTVANAGGSFILKADGVEIINFTGDTQVTAILTGFNWQQLVLSGYQGSVIDDVYICDATGPAPYNAFLGEQCVKAKRVVGNGILNEWGGSDGDSIDNYLMIDEEPPNVTDYVSSNVAGQKDYYLMSAVTGLQSVNALQQIIYASKSDSGTRLVKPLIRNSAGISLAAGDQALSTTWTLHYTTIRTTDPAAAPWTTTSINDIQVGLEVV